MADSSLRIWFALFVLAVFCVGLASGVMIGRYTRDGSTAFSWEPGRGGGMHPGPLGRGGGEPPPEMLLQRLTRVLDLNADQQTAIRSVLESSRERVDTLQRDVHDRFKREQDSLRTEIRKHLTPDQQAQFDRWISLGPRGRGRGQH